MVIIALSMAVLLAASTAAAPASAEAPAPAAVARAKELFQAAQKLYKQGRYAEAVARFEEAYATRPHPSIFFNIGKCWEQLEETAKALRAYRDYLRLSPDAPDRTAVSDAVANLERRLREKGLQQLIVFSDPPGARVEIDGKDLGTAPVSVELIAGNHRLAVRSDGYETAERTFAMAIARASEMTINLQPKGSMLPPPPVPLVEAPAAGPTELARPSAALTPAPRGRTWTWVAGGVAAGCLATGVGLGLAANGAAGELRTLTPARTREQADALAGQAGAMATGANVAYGVAAAAAVTAIVLYFIEGRPAEVRNQP
jgi:tetratricopeptide (TPR) repeat protein